MRLLLIDDDTITRDVIRRCLEPLYVVTHASTANEASQILRYQAVHLVLLESRLPDGCGLRLLGQIRHEYPSIPTIMVTSFGSEEICASAFKLGVKDYLRKPLGQAAVLGAVQQLLPTLPQSEAPHAGALRGVELGVTSAAPLRLTREEQRVREAVSFIQEHYWEHLTLPDVARVSGMGKFAFSHAFSTVMRLPFRSYLIRVRVARAVELLGEPSRSVIEIGQMVGFGDLSRFNKAFKKYVGLPPTAYRKRMVARNA